MKFQHNSIDSMSQYAQSIVLPYIVVYMLQVTEPFTYARVEIIGGYYDGRSYVLKVHDAAGNPIPDASDQNKNDGGGEGNDGQGGGRGESPYVPDTPNDKDETNALDDWTGCLTDKRSCKRTEKKREGEQDGENMKENRMQKQTTAQSRLCGCRATIYREEQEYRLYTDKAVAKRCTAGISYTESGCLKGHDNR